MTKILVLYYSSYGHTSAMAEAVAQGVREGGAEAVIRHVPETAPEEVAKNAGFTGMPGHDEIDGPDELAEYDGIIVGSPTRYGRMTSQMAAFWDTTGGLWMKGALIGKVGAAFTSTGGMHSGNEMTLLNLLLPFLQHGMILAGVPHSVPALVHTRSGGSPYGASAVTGFNGTLGVDEGEQAIAQALGARVARLAGQVIPEPASVDLAAGGQH